MWLKTGLASVPFYIYHFLVRLTVGKSLYSQNWTLPTENERREREKECEREREREIEKQTDRQTDRGRQRLRHRQTGDREIDRDR